MCQTQRPHAMTLAHDSVGLVVVVYPYYDALAQSCDIVDTTRNRDHMQDISHDVHVLGCVYNAQIYHNMNIVPGHFC